MTLLREVVGNYEHLVEHSTVPTGTMIALLFNLSKNKIFLFFLFLGKETRRLGFISHLTFLCGYSSEKIYRKWENSLDSMVIQLGPGSSKKLTINKNYPHAAYFPIFDLVPPSDELAAHRIMWSYAHGHHLSRYMEDERWAVVQPFTPHAVQGRQVRVEDRGKIVWLITDRCLYSYGTALPICITAFRLA